MCSLRAGSDVTLYTNRNWLRPKFLAKCPKLLSKVSYFQFRTNSLFEPTNARYDPQPEKPLCTVPARLVVSTPNSGLRAAVAWTGHRDTTGSH